MAPADVGARRRRLQVLLAASVAPCAFGELWMPSHFADGMPLQTWNKYHTAARLYGTGIPGEIINATTDNGAPWMSAQASADGTWGITYNLPPGSSWTASFTMTVRGNESTNALVFKNVVWGDLYFCVGDSAVLLPLSLAANGSAWLSSPRVAKALEGGRVRLFAAGAAPAEAPARDFAPGPCAWPGVADGPPCNTWVNATPANAAGFSALCLQTVLSIVTTSAPGGNPGNAIVGLVQLAAPSLPVESLLPPGADVGSCPPWTAPAPPDGVGSWFNGLLAPIAAQTPRGTLLASAGSDLTALAPGGGGGNAPGAYACRLAAVVGGLRGPAGVGSTPLLLPLAQPGLGGDPEALWTAGVEQASLLPHPGGALAASVGAYAADQDSNGGVAPQPGTPVAPRDTQEVAARLAAAMVAVGFWEWELPTGGPLARAAAPVSGGSGSGAVEVSFAFSPNASTTLPNLGLVPSPGCTAGAGCCSSGTGVAVQVAAARGGPWFNASAAVGADNATLVVTPGSGAPPALAWVRYGAAPPGGAQCFVVDTSSGMLAPPFVLQVQAGGAGAMEEEDGFSGITGSGRRLRAQPVPAPAPESAPARWVPPPPASEHLLRPDGSFDRAAYLVHGRQRARAAAAALAEGRLVAPDVLQSTPPMGFNGWNAFRCNMDETLLTSVGAALVSSGLASLGYNTVSMDDCEYRNPRLPNGSLAEDTARFPSGFFALGDALARLGLRFGVYTSATANTCVGRPGAYRHEDIDAARFCAWGARFVKVDHCGGQAWPALNTSWLALRAALDAHCGAGTAVLSVESCGDPSPSGCGGWIRTSGAQMWRTTDDLQMYWESLVSNLEGNERMAPLAGPGAYNDPDMLIVGHPGLTPDEQRSQVGGWAVSAAPLLISTDVSNPSIATPALLALLNNPEVVAVDQDPAVVQGVRVTPRNATGGECWARPLASGGGNATAVWIINFGSAPTDVTCDWAAVAPGHMGPSTVGAVRDLWAREDLGTFTGAFTARGLPPHGSVLLRVEPVA